MFLKEVLSLCINRYGPLNESIIKNYTKQILWGLEYLHSHLIVHHDLKWANVLKDSSKTVKLSDFGWATVISDKVEEKEAFSAIKGTIPWMAPEVIQQQGYCLKSDIWSLGWTIIEMAVAGNPWGRVMKNIQDMISMIVSNKKPNIPENLSEWWKDFIDKCLITDINQRPTAIELLSHPFMNSE